MKNTLTLKIPEGLNAELKAYSKRKGVSKSLIVREALAEYLSVEKKSRQGSFYELAEDLAGSVEEAPDLSLNKKHLSGYGQ